MKVCEGSLNLSHHPRCSIKDVEIDTMISSWCNKLIQLTVWNILNKGEKVWNILNKGKNVRFHFPNSPSRGSFIYNSLCDCRKPCNYVSVGNSISNVTGRDPFSNVSVENHVTKLVWKTTSQMWVWETPSLCECGKHLLKCEWENSVIMWVWETPLLCECGKLQYYVSVVNSNTMWVWETPSLCEYGKPHHFVNVGNPKHFPQNESHTPSTYFRTLCVYK